MSLSDLRDQMNLAHYEANKASERYNRLTERIENRERRRLRSITGGEDPDSLAERIKEASEKSVSLQSAANTRKYWHEECLRLAAVLTAEVAYAQYSATQRKEQYVGQLRAPAQRGGSTGRSADLADLLQPRV